MNRQKEIQEQLDHTLDRLLGIFKIGIEKEKSLACRLELAKILLSRAIPEIYLASNGNQELVEEIKVFLET